MLIQCKWLTRFLGFLVTYIPLAVIPIIIAPPNQTLLQTLIDPILLSNQWLFTIVNQLWPVITMVVPNPWLNGYSNPCCNHSIPTAAINGWDSALANRWWPPGHLPRSTSASSSAPRVNGWLFDGEDWWMSYQCIESWLVATEFAWLASSHWLILVDHGWWWICRWRLLHDEWMLTHGFWSGHELPSRPGPSADPSMNQLDENSYCFSFSMRETIGKP